MHEQFLSPYKIVFVAKENARTASIWHVASRLRPTRM